jgi:hypothetical protein
MRAPRKWTKTVKNGIVCSRDFKERFQSSMMLERTVSGE